MIKRRRLTEKYLAMLARRSEQAAQASKHYEEIIKPFLQAHPKMAGTKVAQALGIPASRVYMSEAWAAHEQKQLEKYLKEHPTANIHGAKRAFRRHEQ